MPILASAGTLQKAATSLDPWRLASYTAGLSERVAQVVEHVTFNHGVEGSSPSAITIDIIKYIGARARKFLT